MTNYQYHTGEMEKIVLEFAKTNNTAIQRFLLDISNVMLCRETGRGYIASLGIRYPDLMALILGYQKTQDPVISPRYAVPYDPDCSESRNFWYFIQTYWPHGEIAFENAKASLNLM